MGRGATVEVNGVTLAYRRHGAGPPVLLVAPAAARAALWDMHQVPALVAAGYEVITFDNRGTVPSSSPPGPYRLAELVADTAGLIRALGIGPCRVAGSSLGAMVAQELALVRPDLVTGIALLGTRGRLTHYLRALTTATAQAVRHADTVPAGYAAVTGMGNLFGQRTLADDKFAAEWLALAEAFPVAGDGPASQYDAAAIPDRLAALSAVATPTLVMAFEQDVITPVELCREVAGAITGSTYVEVKECGHFGFLERPDEVNAHVINFFDSLATPAW
ncbi:alpha/beta hydrolase [Polymorphospora sp. NPDC050346]|uniref:alpha/beta fold hydrolase n=1 Tax=Polymorphospora sp. NPDC050346 TaxID=3155780 RepID=UPI0033DFE9AB